MESNFQVKIFLGLLMVFSLPVSANNFCQVSRESPTFAMGFEQVDQLVRKAKPKASVACGLLKNLYKLEAGHTTEEHYKNVVLLVDGDDERFVVVAKTKELSIFAYTNNMGNQYHVAVKGEVARLRPLVPGALASVGFEDVAIADGLRIYMPVFYRLFYY